jgi:DNA polymerase
MATKRAATKRDPSSPDDATPLVPASKSLAVVAAAAAGCRACPLWADNAGTVFGEGPAQARVVLVGEQPGDIEDREGRPFVGPAGRMLDACLEEAGLERASLYLTNAVKHFAHHRVGKRRLHDKPKAGDVRACKPWLEAELQRVRPEVLVALGATAAQAIFGSRFSVTRDRGVLRPSPYAARTLATFHPSALLRARAVDADRAAEMRAQLVADLALVKRALVDRF